MISAGLLALLLPALAQDTGLVAPPIVGGNQTTSAEWPDVVWVDTGDSICTGTIIGPSTVLTAAHCTGVRRVGVGTDDYWYDGGTYYNATSTAYHPSYRDDGYDIAVITLATPILDVEPRVMALDCAAPHVVDGATAWIVGYGATTPDGNDDNSAIYEAQITVTDANCDQDEFCDSSMPEASELFAGGNGVDSCFGDSGGPLYVQTPYGLLLVGVTSRIGSEAYYYGPSCGPGGIYTRADTMFDWVQANSIDTLPRPTCGQVPEVAVVPFGDVGNKGTNRTTFSVNDPDSTSWTYSVSQVPSFGTVGVEGNELTFTGDGSYVGADSFVFRVTDDGGLYTDVEVPLNIVKGRAGCGCDSGGSAVVWMLPLVGLLVRRRE